MRDPYSVAESKFPPLCFFKLLFVDRFDEQCLPLSPSQLRELWDFDNNLAHQIMGAPLRTCSSMSTDTEQGKPALQCTIQISVQKYCSQGKFLN